jgi:hypothetical protein
MYWNGSSLAVNGDIIATSNINANAVTNLTSTFSSLGYLDLSHTYTSTGNLVNLIFSCTYRPGWYTTGGQNPQNYSGPTTITMKRGANTLYAHTDSDRDGAGYYDENGFLTFSPPKTFVFPYLDTPPAGPVTYSIVLSGSGGSSQVLILEYKMILALEVKR